MALKSELTFGVNNFGEQNKLTQAQTIAQMVMNILLMRPGQLPSLPHIGINIKQYLYKFQEDLDVEDLKNKISSQCSSLVPYLDLSNMQLLVVPYNGESILFISIPFSVYVDDTKSVLIGFKKSNETSEVVFNYQVTDSI